MTRFVSTTAFGLVVTLGTSGCMEQGATVADLPPEQAKADAVAKKSGKSHSAGRSPSDSMKTLSNN